MTTEVRELEGKVGEAQEYLAALRRLLLDLSGCGVVLALQDLDRILPAVVGTLEAHIDPAGGRVGQAACCAAKMQHLRRELAEEWQLLIALLNGRLLPRAVLALEDAQAELAVALTEAEPVLVEEVVLAAQVDLFTKR